MTLPQVQPITTNATKQMSARRVFLFPPVKIQIVQQRINSTVPKIKPPREVVTQAVAKKSAENAVTHLRFMPKNIGNGIANIKSVLILFLEKPIEYAPVGKLHQRRI